jgi:uncharacterized coiled-coil DUF342 family protein
MKGLGFNVTLSKEQMEEIASLTADKVNYTKDKLHNNDQLYKREIEKLENRIIKLNQLIVGKELTIEQYDKAVKRWKDIAEKYEEKYGESL